MSKIYRMNSTMIWFSLLLNIAVSSLAFSYPSNHPNDINYLATPSRFDEITGIQNQDIGRIEFTLELHACELEKEGGVIDIDKLIAALNEFRDSKSKPPFTFQRVESLLSSYSCILCSTHDSKYGARTYYAVLPNQKIDGGFLIEVYTENEYVNNGISELIRSGAELPRRSGEGRALINRTVQHERGIDTVLRYAYEHDLAKKPLANRFNYEEEVRSLLDALKIKVTAPEGLRHPAARTFNLVNKEGDKNIKKMLESEEFGMAIIVDSKGNEHKVYYTAHPSNEHENIFVNGETFDILTNPDSIYARDPERLKTATAIVRAILVHDLGAMLGFNIYPIKEKEPVEAKKVQNTLDQRYKQYLRVGSALPEWPWLEAEVVDLNTFPKRDVVATSPKAPRVLTKEKLIVQGFSQFGGKHCETSAVLS